MIKVYNLIGLAHKAGKVSSGAAAAKSSVAGNRARLLVLSGDAAENTRLPLVALCRRRSVPYCTLGSQDRLGLSVGKPCRAALTVNDIRFARAILEALKEGNTVEVVEWPK